MKKLKKAEEIRIVKLPIDVGNDVAFSMVIDDRVLIDSICRVADNLRKQGVEVFSRQQNVIATEDGFFFAIREEDAVAVESGTFKPE
jgi:hypothetical protein